MEPYPVEHPTHNRALYQKNRGDAIISNNFIGLRRRERPTLPGDVLQLAVHSRWGNEPTLSLTSFLNIFRQPNLYQGLIRHVPLVSFYFNTIQQAFR